MFGNGTVSFEDADRAETTASGTPGGGCSASSGNVVLDVLAASGDAFRAAWKACAAVNKTVLQSVQGTVHATVFFHLRSDGCIDSAGFELVRLVAACV